MTSRAAALAIAAPLLIAAPALADHDRTRGQTSGATISVQTELGGIYYNAGTDRIGYRPNHTYYGRDRYHGQNQRRAVRACRRAIKQEARAIGFRDIDFDSRGYAQPIGRGDFRVTFREVEFEGRRREFERQVSCLVRRGDQVRQIDGLPHHGHHRRDDRRRYRY